MAVDRDRVVADLAPEWLDGLDGAELEKGRTLLTAVVDEWAREADSTPDPDAVLALHRAALAEKGKGQDAAGRLRVLQAQVTERSVERLNSETLELGKAILAGSVDDADARARGEAFLARAEQLAKELDELGRPQDDPFRRELGDAVMDALYAVERQAMSIRLSREAPGAAAPPSVS